MTVPPEEQEAWKNWLGTGLMAAPLLFGMARGVAMPVAKLLEVPLDQLTRPQRKRLNDLARRRDADPAVVSRVEAMWQRDIRTKPQELMSETEKTAAKGAFRQAGATGGRPTLNDEVYRERLPKLEAEQKALNQVDPKTLSDTERAARKRRMNQVRVEIAQTKRHIAETPSASQATPEVPVDPTVPTPETQPATPQTLSDLLHKEKTGKVPETPAKPATPETPVRPAAPETAVVPEVPDEPLKGYTLDFPPGTKLVSAREAYDEHYATMANYIHGALLSPQAKGRFSKTDFREEVVQDIISRTWQSLANKAELANDARVVAAGRPGWDNVLRPFVIQRIKDVTLKKRPYHPFGSPGTGYDMYEKVHRKEFTKGIGKGNYDEQVGRLETAEAPGSGIKGMSPQEAALDAKLRQPLIEELLKDVAADKPEYKPFLEAWMELMAENPGMKKIEKPMISQRLKEKGILTDRGNVPEQKTLYNWETDLKRRAAEMDVDPEIISKLLPAILAALGIGGAGAGALSRLLAEHRQRAQHSSHVTPVAA